MCCLICVSAPPHPTILFPRRFKNFETRKFCRFGFKKKDWGQPFYSDSAEKPSQIFVCLVKSTCRSNVNMSG